MERGELAVDGRPSTVFVFEGLIAHLSRPRLEKAALQLHRWSFALDFWAFDIQVCDYIHDLIYRYNVPVEIITWHPLDFLPYLNNRLWSMDVPVRSISCGEYESLSPKIAVDREISVVYDPNQDHRFGYGFKQREFSVGRF